MVIHEAEKRAKELATSNECVGIIVNRVRTARELKAKFGDDAVLLTGRMRPLDRDRLFIEKLQPLLSNAEGTPPKFVIGTQCLECGADFDFHALVTECASLDALRQRFGRLNRVARRDQADAYIVVRGDEVEDTSEDPVYGESLANTWNWLNSKAKDGAFNFGVEAVRAAIGDEDITRFNAPTSDAPVLFPAHLDCWVQTHPLPVPDPDPALFLHGPKQKGQPDVKVVFRADLGGDPELWADIVSLCPPSSSEAVAVPIGQFKKWLAGEIAIDESADVVDSNEEAEEDAIARSALRWRGPDKSAIIDNPHDIRPEDTFVVPCSASNIEMLGDFPYGPSDDGDAAFQRSRDKAILRLTTSTLNDEDDDFIEKLTQEIESLDAADSPEWMRVAARALAKPKSREVERHPSDGWVVTGKRPLKLFDPIYLDDSEPAESFRGRVVELEEHSRGVATYARRFASACGLDGDLYYQAGLWHDLGKLDPRFQAMLKQSSPRTVVGKPWAKSAKSPRTPEERRQAREVHCYPVGARHELLSAALLSVKADDDLLLHLVSTHHGSARPFALPVEENDTAKSPFKCNLFGVEFKSNSSSQRIAEWNAEHPDRFWRIVRTHGWWGAAYREAIFRLADHAQSRDEQEREAVRSDDFNIAVFKARVGAVATHSVPLSGLDGGNPLAFLAAIGSLVSLDQLSHTTDAPRWLKGRVALSWGHDGSPLVPVLHFDGLAPTSNELVAYLIDKLPRNPEQHDSAKAIEVLVCLQNDKELDLRQLTRNRFNACPKDVRGQLDWVAALSCETDRDLASQLQTVRRDYLIDNIRAVMQLTKSDHLSRTLFEPWDYADGLANQSLHWEPTEDRRHAYQWHMPSGDPTRKRRGGMLGANRLAYEAWRLFPSFPAGDRLATRGFRGNRAYNTFWTWPLWTSQLTVDSVASILSLPEIQRDEPVSINLRQHGVSIVFRSQRILVGKTPNLTAALAIA